MVYNTPRMKKQTTIISWNVNGLRAVIKKGFLDFIKKYQPDILCLQETKAEHHQVVLDLPEYTEFWHSSTGKKGYSGTAIFSKNKPKNVVFGFPTKITKKYKLTDEQGRDSLNEGRVITAEFEKFFLVDVYTPNAKDDLSRLRFRHDHWDKAFLDHLKILNQTKPVIACGDFNVAHEEIDLAHPKDNFGKHGFTAEEREGFGNFISAGFVDIFRDQHPSETKKYTWWSHWGDARARNVGWRIDYFLVSSKFKKSISESFILPEVMGSDHCPVGIKVDL